MHQRRLTLTPMGLPIIAYSSWPLESAPPADVVLFIGGVHGDEPEGIVLAQKVTQWLKAQPQSGLHPWVVIECLNPDGYASKARVNSQGVDLNRNFPSPDWSADFTADRYYPGPKPSSTPEVTALVKLLESLPLRLIVHAHSWNPCLVLTGPSATPELQAFSTACGYDLVHDIGYPTPGSLGSYGWQVLKTPVLCIEEKEGTSAVESWKRFEGAIPWLFCTPEEILSRGLK
jgi:protein MpaA